MLLATCKTPFGVNVSALAEYLSGYHASGSAFLGLAASGGESVASPCDPRGAVTDCGV